MRRGVGGILSRYYHGLLGKYLFFASNGANGGALSQMMGLTGVRLMEYLISCAARDAGYGSAFRPAGPLSCSRLRFLYI